MNHRRRSGSILFQGYTKSNQTPWVSEHEMVRVPLGFSTAGLTCAFTQSLSLQSFPCSQGSLLNTMPLSGVATGEG
jgi:hypothetical protein